MKSYLKFLCLILAIITVLGCISCSKNETEETDTAEVSYSLTVGDLSKYSIIRSENADKEFINAVSKLYTAMSGKFGEIKLKTDLIIEGDAEFSETEYEILVGSTNRAESDKIQKQLKKNDYTIRLEGKKLIILGGTDEATMTAIDVFIKDFVNSERTDVFFCSDDTVNFKDSYAVEALNLNGKSIGEYSIVYAKMNSMRELSLATELQEKIADVTGFVLPIYSDAAHEKDGAEILIGKTNRSQISAYSQTVGEEQYCIGFDSDSVYMFGGGYIFAVKSLMNMIDNEAASGADLSIDIYHQICNADGVSEAITSMSFNVYYEIEPNQYNVPDRVDKVRKMVLGRMPDTVGFQECTAEWLNILKDELGEYYNCISGKLSVQGQEYCPIFYRKDKFEVVWKECKWLSNTPDIAYSKVEGASLPRVVTYAKLKRISDGMEFICANTHFDHISHEVGEKQAQILLNILSEYKDMPVFVTGDFNSTPSTKKYTILNSSYLKSSANIATISKQESTIHCYGSANEILDYIFVNESCMYVYKYEVCTEKIDGYYVSDHHPIISKFIIID